MARVRLNWEGETVADRYRITNRLGEGGMGTVYRATDLQSGKTVALKTPRIALLEDPAFFKRFQREMQALLQLRHPYIVPVLDVGEHKRIPFFVMPYLSGGNLRQRFKEKPARGPDDLFPWLAQIAAALDYLHAQNVVHRDVKPDNVLFDEQGVAYLTDLGAVKVQEGSSVDARTKLTATGTALGTPPYMAPELILGRPYDGRADQYALAVIVYEAFTGQHPYDASSLGALIQSLQGPEAERLDSRCGAPTGVAEAVARGLARDPNQRFPSCTEFAKAVRVGFVRSPATLKSPARPSGAGAGTGDRPSPRVMPTVAAGTPPPVIAPGKARPASGDTPAPVGPGLAPTIAASPGAGVPPPVPPTVAASPLPAEPGGVSGAGAFGSPVDALPAPALLRRIRSQQPRLALQLKRTLSQPVVLGVVVAVGVFTIGMLLLALVFGLLRSSPDSAHQVPGSEPSPDPAGTATVPTGPTGGSESRPPMNRGGLDTLPSPSIEPRERIWRVGQNNLTFEQAVARALPGDTIEVPAGRFTLTQSVLVNKSLTIRGAGPDKTTLLSWEPDFAIKFTGDCQWTLENLSLEHVGNKPANVVVVDSGVITIRNCHFSGAILQESPQENLDPEVVRGVGVLLTGTARGLVAGCVCRGNEHSGIAVSREAQPLLERNTSQRNAAGIAYFKSAGGTARNNTCSNNVNNVKLPLGGFGIAVADWAQPTLEGNTCDRNQASGIVYLANARGTAANNMCCNNEWSGILLIDESEPFLEGNTCDGNKGSGIYYCLSPRNDATGGVGGIARKNICRSNDLHGIRVTIKSRPLLHANTCEENKKSGIAYEGDAAGTARNNTCRNNGLDGIGVQGQAQPTLEGNTCEGNKRSGIAYFDSAGGIARNNTCRNNQADGIGLGGEAKPVLEGNSCIENRRHGVCYFSEGKASGRAVNNTCSQNEGSGIAVAGQAQPTLEGNTCEENKVDGIAYLESAGGIARNNICRNNGDNGIYVRRGARPLLGPNILEGNRGGNLNVE